MVLEKAQVMLTSPEFTSLTNLIEDYLTTSIGVDEFASNLIQMFAGGEKVRDHHIKTLTNATF